MAGNDDEQPQVFVSLPCEVRGDARALGCGGGCLDLTNSQHFHLLDKERWCLMVGDKCMRHQLPAEEAEYPCAQMMGENEIKRACRDVVKLCAIVRGVCLFVKHLCAIQVKIVDRQAVVAHNLVQICSSLPISSCFNAAYDFY
jgi:hypothetical protein